VSGKPASGWGLALPLAAVAVYVAVLLVAATVG